MSDPALTRRGAATRDRLLRAAEDELIEREGQLEVAAVAARAEVSVGLLYRYFGSKAGLVAAVVDGFYDRLHEQVADPDPAPDADWATREHERVKVSVAFHYREPFARIALSQLAREPAVAGVEARRIQRLVLDAARNLRGAQRRGEIPEDIDTRTAAAVMIGGHRVAMAEALTRSQPPSEAALTEALWRFAVHGVRHAAT